MIRKMRPASTATLPRAVVVVRIVLNFIIKLTWGIESQGGQFFLGVVDKPLEGLILPSLHFLKNIAKLLSLNSESSM
jgi:hypothetical protein